MDSKLQVWKYSYTQHMYSYMEKRNVVPESVVELFYCITRPTRVMQKQFDYNWTSRFSDLCLVVICYSVWIRAKFKREAFNFTKFLPFNQV